jgi:hypothetical protein
MSAALLGEIIKRVILSTLPFGVSMVDYVKPDKEILLPLRYFRICGVYPQIWSLTLTDAPL